MLPLFAENDTPHPGSAAGVTDALHDAPQAGGPTPALRIGQGAAPDADHAPPPAAPEVRVRVSRRRKKTAVSYWEGDHIVVVLPSHVRQDQRDEMVRWLVERTMARRPAATAGDEELGRRAALLADRYVDGVRPASVRWVTNQHKRWGSCTVDTREIRVSHRLRDVPGWVLDAVLVHELTHLVHADHGPRFHQVANRYPRQHEASVFLDGYSHGIDRSATSPP